MEKQDLSEEDRLRIEQEARRLYKEWDTDNELAVDKFKEMAEYATTYERSKSRELREKVIEEVLDTISNYWAEFWLRLPADVKSGLIEEIKSLKNV